MEQDRGTVGFLKEKLKQCESPTEKIKFVYARPRYRDVHGLLKFNSIEPCIEEQLLLFVLRGSYFHNRDEMPVSKFLSSLNEILALNKSIDFDDFKVCACGFDTDGTIIEKKFLRDILPSSKFKSHSFNPNNGSMEDTLFVEFSY